jgi:hypothetical protein
VAGAALAAVSAGGLGLTGSSLTGMANGGLITGINLNKFYLGVTAEGAFAFLEGAQYAKHGPTWLMPSMFMNRPGSDVRLDLYNVDDRTQTTTAFPPLVPGGYPGVPIGDIESVGPAVLPDGTIVWLPTNRTLMASCSDGRPRWVLEFYNIAPVYIPAVFAAGDGTIILAGGRVGIHRIDPNGHVLASRDLSDRDGSPMGFSDRCGVAMLTADPSTTRPEAVLRYYAGADFSMVRDLPPDAIPTNDCGWWTQTAAAPSVGSRYRPDGTLSFVNAGRQPSLARLELTDSSWLMVDRTAGMSIVADDGTLVFDTDFDPHAVGEELVEGAYMLTPDGVLYVVAMSGVDAFQQFAAIEVGIGSGTTWATSPVWELKGNRGNWARDNATWHPAPAP